MSRSSQSLLATLTDAQQHDCQQWAAKLREVSWAELLHWQPSDRQVQQFETLYQTVLAGNAVQNLTRLTSPDEFFEKHLWDSLRGIQALGSWSELQAQQPVTIDIGSGGGFPGVPLAIALPQWSITLLDSTQRKVAFMSALLEATEVTQGRAIASRVELLHERKQYDIALLRAIGGASACAEYSLPLLKLGGRAILYRGKWTVEEEAELWAALEILGGEIAEVDAFTTPVTHAARHCVVLLKTDETPSEFPRAPGIPKKHPLGAGAGDTSAFGL